MKKIISKLLVLALVFGLVQGATVAQVEAKETRTGVVVGGSEKVFLETGKSYDIPVSFMKADDHNESSMAGASLTGATFFVEEDGTVTVEFAMKDITIMTAWGFANTLSLNNTHVIGASATAMSIKSTYSKKLSYLWNSGTYTIPSEFSGTMPYLDQNGIYAQMALKTGVGDMNQEGYFIFDYASLRADYTAVDAALAKVPRDISFCTDESIDTLNAAVAQVEYYYHKSLQADVTAMAVAVDAAVEALEIDPAKRQSVDVKATVEASPSTFTVQIPETLSLGELSFTEDTTLNYEVGITMIEGNDGRGLEVTVAGKSDEALTNGVDSILFTNSLENHVFTTSDVIQESVTVEAQSIGNAYFGEYRGTMVFDISSEYVD